MERKRGEKEALIPKIKRAISSYIKEEKATINKHALLSLGAFMAAGVISGIIISKRVDAATVTVTHKHSDIGHSNCSHTSCSHSSCTHSSGTAHSSCTHSSGYPASHTSCSHSSTYTHTSCTHSSAIYSTEPNINPAHTDQIAVSTD